jgi:NitT/TauT family transport system substrate-binding protein
MQCGVSRRLRIVATAACLAVTLLTFCQGDGAVQAENVPLIRVGTSSNDGSSVIFYAQDRGFFKKAGLNVEIEPFANGPAMASAVLSGALNVGVAPVVSIALAHLKDLPLIFIAPSAIYSAKAPIEALLVEKGSPITSGSDLMGKTVAVVSLNSLSQLGVEGWIDAHGGHAHSVRYVEMPFSEMMAALQRHPVDAAVIAEPALTLAKSNARVIGYPSNSIGRRFMLTGWFASTDWISKNPGTVARFTKALAEAAVWANDNQMLSAKILVAHTHISARIAAKMTRATFAERLTPLLVQPEIDAAAKYGILHNSFPASEIIDNNPRASRFPGKE